MRYGFYLPTRGQTATPDALEQLSLIASIAGKTRTLPLVSSVMIVPHRNPVFTAKTLATIDVLSHGRVTVS